MKKKVTDKDYYEFLNVIDGVNNHKFTLDKVKIFVEHGYINKQDDYGNTMLRLAIFECKSDIVEYLLYNGANPNFKTKCKYEGDYCLYWGSAVSKTIIEFNTF